MTLVAAGSFLAMPCALAATTSATADQKFILAAAQGGMTKVKLGEFAARNGERADLKEFAWRMVMDLSAINADLKSLAAQKEVTLSNSLDARNQKMVVKLAALRGSAFDKAYIAAMFKGYKMDAKAFVTESAATTDRDLKSFVDKSLPIVQMHLEHIKAMKN